MLEPRDESRETNAERALEQWRRIAQLQAIAQVMTPDEVGILEGIQHAKIRAHSQYNAWNNQ
jgi:hypothetical protein